MPILNREDAAEVDERIDLIFGVTSSKARAAAIREMFVETLDFDRADGLVSLANAPSGVNLPPSAERVAQLDGVHVAYVSLNIAGTDRVRAAEASAASRLIADQLGEDLLLVFTNSSCSQLHFISPAFTGTRPTLRRMIVERDLPRRTAVQQVSNIYWRYRDLGGIRTALAEAFDVEPVTKRFFQEYRRVFELAERSVSGFASSDDETESKRLFVQTVFNRLLFIYFLQRKGWLKFRNDYDYLNALWRDYQSDPEQTNFYSDRLRLLFFGGLNNYLSEDLTAEPATLKLIGEVPFLNGGLFDMTDEDSRTSVFVPDSCIASVFIDLFDAFNFTVMESTPFDIEVAVDPEMLGKVFEELVNERNETGAYYTPRSVVSYMCRETLKGYLGGLDTDLAPEEIARFVDARDTSGISLAAAPKLAEALDEVTVVDPACGSGAYLLGMMQELVELQTALYNVGVDARGLYELKLHIIQRNLYGVDIDEFAINIAMLRMWLALAIEYQGDSPPPLPNLDLKLVCGDSILGPDPSPDNYGDLFRHRVHAVAGRLIDLKARHMDATVGKDTLKGQVERLQRDLRAALADTPAPSDAVDWRVEFAEVFDDGGFDVVVANPPYIQLQKDGGRLGRRYRDVGYTTFVARGDIYQLFYERGCQLLRSSQGMLAYITSNSWLKAEYGRAQRRFLTEQHEPMALIELGKDVFDSAIVDTSILLLRKGRTNGAFPAVDVDHLSGSEFPPEDTLWGQVRPNGEAPWSILSPVEQRVMEKMLSMGTPLKDWDVSIYRGVLTGYNKAFIIDDSTRIALVEEDPRSAEIIKPVLRGRDIQRYRAKWANLWLIATFPSAKVSINDYPAVKNYLSSFGRYRLEQNGKSLPAGGRSRKKTPHSWFELQDSCTYHEDFAKEKLFWMDMTRQARFAYSDAELYCNDKGFILSGGSLKYLCAVLNSSVSSWWMNNSTLTTGMGLAQWKKFAVERLPIPKISAAKQRPFVHLVDEIIESKSACPDADINYLEWEIDRLVNDLYGLTEEEDTAIERSLGLIHASDKEEDAALIRAIEEGLASERVDGAEVKSILRAPLGD